MSQVFDTYARYYDLLYRDKDYAGESEYVVAHIRQQTPQAKRILELGCGTGAHAEHLARMGYTVHGVDMSEAMLARAEARKATLPPEVAARLSFGLGDVRTVRMGSTYDAVISLFHVMSYQTTNEDLHAAFETASVHLKEGGIFIFDFWYGPAVLTDRPAVREKKLEDAELMVHRTAVPVMHPNENIVDVNYEVIIEEKKTGMTKKLKETHKMRYLFLPELDFTLKNVGFKRLDAQEWMSFDRQLSFNSWYGLVIGGKY